MCKLTLKEFQHTIYKELFTLTLDAHIETLAIIEHITKLTKIQIYTNPDTQISDEDTQTAKKILHRRKNREPLPYILNYWDFYGFKFFLNHNVLIPRPETEILVDRALFWLNSRQQAPQVIADIGTGSGCISIAIGMHYENSNIIAIDISKKALEAAYRNVTKYKLKKRIHLVHGDLLNSIIKKFDLIIANLPYIPKKDYSNLQDEIIKFEPHQALIGGEKGTEIIENLILQSKSLLKEDGCFIIEINPPQSSELYQKIVNIWPENQTEIIKDLSGSDRLIISQG